ncbi:MAG TPA: discoidin domain-containing protein [Bacteroidales bacterium]|nr:discoidin domain-containing protein [Bacteroidales bacterium]
MKTKHLFVTFCLILAVTILLPGCGSRDKTLGVGIYPGNPHENFAPVLKPDNHNYRNIAKNRPAWHSSAYDYNLTAQLITDGIITEDQPASISMTTNEGEIPRNEREFVLDHVTGSTNEIHGNAIWFMMNFQGYSPDSINRIVVNGDLIYDEKKAGPWNLKISGSNDATKWEVLGELKGNGFPGTAVPNPYAEYLKNPPKDSTGKPIDPFEDFFGPKNPNEPKPSFHFDFGVPEPSRNLNLTFNFIKPVAYKAYRADFSTTSGKTWHIGDVDFYNNNSPVEMTSSRRFKSAWMSAGSKSEWIYVDLGSYSEFDTIRLHWVNKAISGSVQVSPDARSWKNIAELPGGTNKTDEIPFDHKTKGRYLRLLMQKSADGGPYILSEMEVMGKGGLVPEPQKQPPVSNGRLDLAGGNWKVQRSSLVPDNGEAISNTGYACPDWLVATVPGTILVSYLNAGAIPDPDYGDNQLQISESFFYDDFWYRNEFDVPNSLKGQHTWLNFDGINWKADVYVNGQNTGKIEGAFIHGRFDITNLLKPGVKNSIAVLIHKNDNPGAVTEQTSVTPGRNGGVLGADNPTYHASIGWDWIPTIRGRNTGIWNDVFINSTGAVTLQDPFVYSDLNLPDTTSADIHLEVTLKNNNAEPVSGTLDGRYGDIQFTEKVTLGASASKTLKLDPANHPELRIKNPALWWPKGYGPQNLYEVQLSFKTEDKVSDETHFMSGIREMSYTEDNQALKIYINGRRFIARGGNWGFPESNLRYRSREYDIAVAYHADMNFTMIRNWVAQTADDEFFRACDKYGIMVWQDFCLANPADGPDPNDPDLFNKNSEDVILKIRNHPSIALYVGRNEGNPPPAIDTVLSKLIAGLHPGIHYIPNSASGAVSGGGPYRALPVKDYYLLYGRNKLHSERGMPNVMNFESLRQMLPDSALWPQNSMWGLHDYTLEGAQSAGSFNELLEKGFGKPENAEQFCEIAQWINYDGYRAMFEGRSQYRMGLLLWMSHSAWPSMVWQTYDYYFDPTAAYFGCKKASEPLHIQWNRVYDEVEVVNLNAKDQEGLTARAQVFNMDGKVQWEKEATVNSKEDATDKVFKLEFPSTLSPVHFIRLTLKQGDRMISENFYWRGIEDGVYKALSQLQQVNVKSSTTVKKSEDSYILSTTIENTADIPALMIRLKVIGKSRGERILPVFFSDNYISLMPGEKKIITMRMKTSDARGDKPVVVLSGFNLSN